MLNKLMRKRILMAAVSATSLLSAGAAVAQSSGGAGTALGFRWTPRLQIQETFTDNVNLSSTNRESDFVTQASVGIDGQYVGPRLNLNLNADAHYDLYANTPDLNGWSLSGFGTGIFSVVQDQLTIEALGQLQTRSVSTFGQPAIERTTPQNRVQIGTFTIGPHLTIPVGSFADLNATARVNQVSYLAADGSNVADLPRDSTYIDVSAALDTGDRNSLYQFSLSGEYAHDDEDFELYNAVGSAYFRVSPTVRLIARGGHERVTQPGVVDLSTPTYTAGIELRLNEDSVITVEAGERYENPTYRLDAVIKVNERLFFTAHYEEQIKPSQFSLGDQFAGFVNRSAIAPPGVSNVFVVQGNLTDETALEKTAVAQFVYQWPRQMVDVSIGWTDRELLSSRTSDQTVSADIRYSRELRPDLTGEARLRYDRSYANSAFGEAESYGASVGLIYALRPTTDIRLEYAYQENRELTAPRIRAYENAVSIGLTRRF